jgi:hypothetical protein
MAATDKEIWKPVTHIKGKSSKKYAVSSHGRLASYDKNIEEKFVLKLHLNGGFPMATIHVDGKSKALFVHQALGYSFLKKPSPKYKFVIHLDYNKANNDLSNLKWATKEEQVEHSKKSPYVLAATAHKLYRGATARKLDEKKVIQLKKEIWNPKRKLTLKQIAAKYGIAEMNLYRIKNGELWFHVHIEGEPIFPKYKEQLKNIEFHNKVAAKKQQVADKLKADKILKLKASAEKKKKLAAEKKERLAALQKKRKQKAIERLAIEKRKALRASAKKSTLKNKKSVVAKKSDKIVKSKKKEQKLVNSDLKSKKNKKSKKDKKK